MGDGHVWKIHRSTWFLPSLSLKLQKPRQELSVLTLIHDSGDGGRGAEGPGAQPGQGSLLGSKWPVGKVVKASGSEGAKGGETEGDTCKHPIL